MALVNRHTHTRTLKKSRLRERTDSAWFSRLLRHPARKRCGAKRGGFSVFTPTPFQNDQIWHGNTYGEERVI